MRSHIIDSTPKYNHLSFMCKELLLGFIGLVSKIYRNVKYRSEIVIIDGYLIRSLENISHLLVVQFDTKLYIIMLRV